MKSKEEFLAAYKFVQEMYGLTNVICLADGILYENAAMLASKYSDYPYGTTVERKATERDIEGMNFLKQMEAFAREQYIKEDPYAFRKATAEVIVSYYPHIKEKIPDIEYLMYQDSWYAERDILKAKLKAEIPGE